MINIRIAIYALVSLAFSSSSIAGVILSSDRTNFENLGNIVFNQGFESYGSGFDYPGTPITIDDVTYNSTENLTIGPSGSYTTNGTVMMTNNYWNPIKGTINPGYNLFGFDAGWMNQDDQGSVFSISTNLNSYAFNVDLADASDTDFFGFIADAGEYFTAWELTSTYEFALIGIDNVTLGNVQNVPEPSLITLFGLGLLGLGFARRRKA